ncbi:reverse transcriptase [Gossypium australe]|uniref:Reverse transcriptase n=1 Tax=Gossypium australe TaxID=47621 RepID=A0A5B6WM87_9ROSI|nr:reverse transcriptase [Gossypium australe]
MEGVSATEVVYMLQVTGFKARQLPVHYFGVSLVPKQLSIADCKPIIEIKVALFEIQAFWNRQFLLTQSVLKQVNQLYARFFWKVSNIKATGARVIEPNLASRWNWKRILSFKELAGTFVRSLPIGIVVSSRMIWEDIRKKTTKALAVNSGIV